MAIVNIKNTGQHLLVSSPAVKAISSALEVDMLDSSVSVISVDNEMGFDSSDQNVNGWISRIKEELYYIPSVEDIFVSIQDNDVDVWVVIPNRDIGALRQIVEGEGELLKTFVSGESPAFLMDFHIVYRCGRNIEELAPARAIRIPREV